MSGSQGGLNDFVVRLANVNGSGSASANALLTRAIVRMGVPAAGKNYFPSNIQGLPTWFEIRVNEEGRLARSGRVDLVVAMNAETYAQDLAAVSPGGTFLYDDTWPRRFERDGVRVFGIPFARLCAEHYEAARTRILMKNVAVLGALVALLDLEMEVVRALVEENYRAKPHLAEANMRAIGLGHDHARAHLPCPLPVRVAPRDAAADQVVLNGNSAAALGCVYAGATFGAWYPITPSTSLMDAFKGFCERYRTEPGTGRKRYCIQQAEDELGAIGMAVGAGWAGARAFTSTSGPGLSLMSEFLGFAYFAEIPLVVFDVQRAGPSTGMPTRTQQSDLMACAYASHGDTRQVLLFPADPAECFDFAVRAFDLADRLQTPVIVVSDLDIGMNEWLCPRPRWDEGYRPDRGKVLDAGALAELGAFRRYEDRDGDGICYRTLPGVDPRGAYFTRGSGHDPQAAYTEDPVEYRRMLDRLLRKWSHAAERAPRPVLRPAPGSARRGPRPRELRSGGARSLCPARRGRRRSRLPARARLSLPRRGGGLSRRARVRVRSGAEPRRPAPGAAPARSRRRPQAPRLRPELRRPAARRPERGRRGARAP